MNTEIASWSRDCVSFQLSKPTRQPRASLKPIPTPQRRFSHLHVDIVDPPPVSEEGFMYLMTMIDRTRRWVEAVPLKGIAAASYMEAFLSK